MGNQQSLDHRYKEFLSKWIMMQTVIDPRYGQVSIYSSIEGELVCLITKTTTQTVNDKPHQIDLKHPNLVNLYIYDVIKSKDICNSSTQINIVYEYLSNDLLKSIGFRSKQKAMFTEPQIWLIIKSVLNALNYLTANRIDHQNLTPENILITRSGQIKLLDPNLLGNTSNYLQTLLNIKEDIYLSPEQLEGARLKKPNIKCDKERSEVFTFGLCLIRAITLESLQYILNRNALEISFPHLNLVISNIHAVLGYSNQLSQFLSLMLQQKPAKRPTFQQLLTIIDKCNYPIADTVLDFGNNNSKKMETSPPSISTGYDPSIIDCGNSEIAWSSQNQIQKPEAQNHLKISKFDLQQLEKSNQMKNPKSEPVQKPNIIPQKQHNNFVHFNQEIQHQLSPTRDGYQTGNIAPKTHQNISHREYTDFITDTQQYKDTSNNGFNKNLQMRKFSQSKQVNMPNQYLTHRNNSFRNHQSAGNLNNLFEPLQKQNFDFMSELRQKCLRHNEEAHKQKLRLRKLEPQISNEDIQTHYAKNVGTPIHQQSSSWKSYENLKPYFPYQSQDTMIYSPIFK